jgi:hypothetical protein
MYRSKSMFDKLPFAPIVGGLFGLVTAILVVATPGWLFARAVVNSGLPSILSAAQPPLGDTARILTAIVLGALVAALIWAAVHFAERYSKRNRAVKAPKAPMAKGERIAPILAPPSRRKPIFAEAELGAPFMSDEAMEVAKNELILDVPLAEPISPPLAPLFPIAVEPAPELAEEADALAPPHAPVAQVPARKTLARPVEFESIEGLMSRLESALALRQSAKTPRNPIPAGDIASLRRALGASG